MAKIRKTTLRTLRLLLGYLSLFALGLGLGMLLLGYLLAGEIYDFEDSVSQAHLPQVDAIVCLGGGRGRIAAAGDVWNRYWELAHPETSPIAAANSSPEFPVANDKIPILYFAGMGRQISWGQLSKQLRRGVVQRIRQDDIVIERESSNTETNAIWLSRATRERHWNRILLVTSSYHIKRSLFIFNHVLGASEHPVDVETLSVNQFPFEEKVWRTDVNGVRVSMMEYFKWVYYRAIWRSL